MVPCRTVRRLRQKQPGPRPLRGRVHDRYGLPGLTDREKNLADSDAALLLKQVGLFIRSEECRERHRVRTAFLLESPQEEVKRLVEECKQPFNVRHVTLVELLGSRHVSEILVALGKCIAKFNTTGIKINRLHSDRAKELLSKKVEKWCSERLIRQSMTEGDDPASNGHVESEVNQLKRPTCLYLRVAGSEVTDWPQAMRYCAEEQMRQQLEKL